MRAYGRTPLHPLERIDRALAAGDIHQVGAALQKTYYLLSDPRYDKKSYGEGGGGSEGGYDCSATIFLRQIIQKRRSDKNFDPYGLLLKPWMDEADRILKQGFAKQGGAINGVPIRLLMPRGRLRRRVISYRELADQIVQIVSDHGQQVSRWAQDIFGRVSLKTRPADYSWPPEFLKGEVPYLNSYFDKHPLFSGGMSKKWDAILEEFFVAAGVPEAQQTLKRKPAWTWIISDRVRRNTLVWNPRGQSLLFVSPLCLDLVVKKDWSKTTLWQQALREGLLHEIMLAYYLSGKEKSFMKDPMMDAVIQGAAQSFVSEPGPLYSHGPLFTGAGQVTLSDEVREDSLRYGTAPLWNYLYRLKGKKFLRAYLKQGKKPSRYLRKALKEKTQVEDRWVSFAAWLLSLDQMPQDLREGMSSFVNKALIRHAEDINLRPINPPKGTIGSAETPVLPYSFRVFHVPVKRGEKIAELHFRWEPMTRDLAAYLFLARGRRQEQAQFLDFAPIKAGISQEMTLDPQRPPTEVFLVVINRGKKTYPADDLRLQVTVIPKNK